MTTIAVAGNQIAGDRQATHSGGAKFKIKSKLMSFNTPALWPKAFHVGLCGDVNSFADVLEWFTNPSAAPGKLKNCEGIILTEDKKIFTFFGKMDNWIAVDQKYYAIGSGSNFAMGAMAAGATALEAVKHASTLDPSTGMGFTNIVIKQ